MVSIGLAQRLQPQIDDLQSSIANLNASGTPLSTDSSTFKALDKFSGDLMNNNITYYRDANPFGLTQQELLTLNNGQNALNQEMTRVKSQGPASASPEKILGALDSIEAILPPTSTSSSSTTTAVNTPTQNTTSTGNASTNAGSSNDGATASELLGMVKDVDSSADKYTLIKEAISKLREGGSAPVENASPTSSETPSKASGDDKASEKASGGEKGKKADSAEESDGTAKTQSATASSGSAAPIDSAAFDKLLTALGDLAKAVTDMTGISEQAKGQILDKIADILQAVQGIQANAAETTANNAAGTIDPALLTALNTLNEQVQNTLPEGDTKKAVQDLIADILQTLSGSAGGNAALTSQINNVLSSANATGSESLIKMVNELSSTVSSAGMSSN